ncbi:type II toxin-antitoxin system VapB family antitoxin [Actinoplanes oblitus]|uniref:Type II toxin-antitoxin system VapB family antitoxin n=1 Tax=Actinoplanes oblitus TaxID=3040509 RepID=A0ABY8WLN8_9ACTN|nr:type II toxin-antitoxin system VapB family antitoxin [Actinoplanes oblitus]WIM97760.1 type II toxin-antitoxin system VapB family antitoxin [Actinoplanes oblitus]
METAMTETRIRLEDEALAEAMALLGTTTPEETVNLALHEIAAVRRRLAAYFRLKEMAARGDFDMLLDKRNYRR